MYTVGIVGLSHNLGIKAAAVLVENSSIRYPEVGGPNWLTVARHVMRLVSHLDWIIIVIKVHIV